MSEDFSKLLEKYVEDVSRVTSEANKSFFFIQLVQNTFRANIDYLEKVFPQIEKFVKYKGKVVASKGEIDSLLGNAIIEFESNIQRKKNEAEQQLKQYIAILWNKETAEIQKRINYIAIATDGLYFHVYRPESTEEGELSEDDISLIPIENFEIKKMSPREVMIWLDYTFLSKEAKIPTTEGFTEVFGVGTSFYKSVISDLQLAVEVFQRERKETFNTLFSEWSRYLSIAYGSSVESIDFFVKHTYLSILAKLMIYSFLSKGVVPIEEKTVLDVLGGEEFRKWGIRNFFEEDFFSWITKEPVRKYGVKAAKNILDVLAKYDLTKLNEDILKGLYENLLDQQERHDLGEVYTPDWLVESILRHSLKEGPEKTLLDPACGSGTFLFLAIRLKKESLKRFKKNEMLTHVLESVKGIDIHPLAVLIAKTNYLLALGDLVRLVPRGEIVLPVYMADSIRLIDEDKTFYENVNSYRIPTIDDKTFFFLPSDFVEEGFLDTEKIDALIDLIRELSIEFLQTKSVNNQLIEEFLNSNLQDKEKIADYVNVVSLDVRTLSRIVRMKRDTIWTYILKNKHKPIDFTYRKFDLIVGNPPWIVYNSVKNVNYQQFLKKLIKDEYHLVHSSPLITNMEIATLFCLRCTELYLNDNSGEFALVMPRSLFPADQHANFRDGTYKKVKQELTEIWDLDNVSPLFRVPSCVIFGRKNSRTKFPVPTKIFNGTLEKKNEEYTKAMLNISSTESKLYLSRIGKRNFFSSKRINFVGKTPYYEKFYRGAEILPQSFWLVYIVQDSLGYDSEKPYVRTSESVQLHAKKPWNDITFEGNIEARFIYDVVICSYLFPFSFKTSKAVLPVEPNGASFRIVTKSEAKERYQLLEKWLNKAEATWKEKRKEKQDFDIIQWINYNGKLTRQNPRKRYKVIYNKTGQDVVAAVADLKQYGTKLIMAEATIYFETDKVNEAYYLASILNSPIVNAIIKPMQAKGLFGERGIEKKVLELPIPIFKETNLTHQRIAELGKEAAKKSTESLEQLLTLIKGAPKPTQIARIRSRIRSDLNKEIQEINMLTKKVLKEAVKGKKGILDFFKTTNE